MHLIHPVGGHAALGARHGLLDRILRTGTLIIESASHRTESRGAHQRTDFPGRDDDRFLAHTMAHREPDGSARIDYLPVTITRWPPGERIYGR